MVYRSRSASKKKAIKKKAHKIPSLLFIDNDFSVKKGEGKKFFFQSTYNILLFNN